MWKTAGEILKTDLERLVVDGFPEAHFKDPQRQTLMLDVLTVWAARTTRAIARACTSCSRSSAKL